MVNSELAHHGILGMKWGIRRSKAQLQRASPSGKKSSSSDDSGDMKNKGPSTKKTTKEMTDDELRKKISRLELEKRYKDLSKSDEAAKVSKGKEFVVDVLEKSGKNIATQLSTYVIGEAVNKIAGSEIVNPKKGQKDK